MVLLCRSICRAIWDWFFPCFRSAESIYLSSSVIWWYFMCDSPYLAVWRIEKYPRSPSFLKFALHLVYEFAPSNKPQQQTSGAATVMGDNQE